ncbi:uncharacterized protein LOC116928293 isoform X2 [Daphnia magna]|nr:uncharacterized protein LOC116928293 isoform X2 [Daphnia magna]
MYLPDIHICDTSLFSRSALESMGFNKTMGSYLALTLSPMLASRSLRKDTKRRQELEIIYNVLMENRTIHDVYERATLKCENIILGCTHDVTSYNSFQCCQKIFGNRTYVTDLATMCVSTAKQQPLEEIFASQIYGLTVYLKTNTHDRFEFDSTIVTSNVASRRGLLYAVSDPITAVNPIVSAAGHYMAPGKWAGVSISFTRTDNSELQTGILSPYSCVPSGTTSHSHLVPNYDVYSERNCIFASARVVLERKFNCTIFRFRKTHQHVNVTPCCDPDIMIGAYSLNLAQKIKRQSAGCPIDCIVNDYNLYSTPSQLYLGDQDEFFEGHKNGEHVVYSAIHFFYPSFSYTVIKNHPQRLVKWLSDVGSNMSLYLGASFVTLLEFIVLVLRCARFAFQN